MFDNECELSNEGTPDLRQMKASVMRAMKEKREGAGGPDMFCLHLIVTIAPSQFVYSRS